MRGRAVPLSQQLSNKWSGWWCGEEGDAAAPQVMLQFFANGATVIRFGITA